MEVTTLLLQVRALLRDIRVRYGWRMSGLVLLMTVVALTEGLGMALLLPLLSAIGVSGPASGGALGDVLAGLLHALGVGDSAYQVAAVLLVVFALQLALYVVQNWWMAWLQRDYGAHWQKSLFDALVHAEWSFFSHQKLGHLSNLMTQETARLSGACLILAQFASILVAALVYLAVAFVISWEVTALMTALALSLFIAVRSISRKNYRIGLRLGPLSSELNVMLTEFLGGIKLIKATATEDIAARKVGAVVEDLRIQHTWATFLPALVKAIFEFSAMAALCFILVYGYHHLEVPAASMLVVLALFVRLLPRFNALQQNIQLLATYVPAFTAVRAMLDEALAQSEHPRYRKSASRPMTEHLQGRLRLSIERGGYKDVAILHDIRLELPERGVVGIIGESGAGKSTLVNCLLGLAEVSAGTIRFGDVDMQEVPLDYWRRQIGYVSQETVLFHQSIRDNIAWGREQAGEAEIMEASRQALAHEFILEQPRGYETVIGDQGVRLSGGQRQRLGIARALLGKPRLLIMDEATSALDSASEACVMEAVDRLRREICVVMVAHRLATVRAADLIVVMDQGRIVETGSWDALTAGNGALSRMAAAQHIE